MTNKRILITGASGFIGGFLVKEALQRGYDVWAGIRQGSSRQNLQDERIHFIDLHYNDFNALTAQLHEIAATFGAWHYVVHNAGVTKTLHPDEFYQVNSYYTAAFLEALAFAGCKPDKFLLMSSLSSYGSGDTTSLNPILLTDEQKPASIYGKSKMLAEQFVKDQTHFPYVILCPTGVYGPGEKDYMKVIKSIQSGVNVRIGRKPQHLTFIYVKDLATAAFLALENPTITNTTYFVTDGQRYTDDEYAGIIKKLLGKRFTLNIRIPLWVCHLGCTLSEWGGKLTGKAMTLNTDKYRILKQRNWTCDAERTQKELGFTSRYNLEAGLEEIIRGSN